MSLKILIIMFQLVASLDDWQPLDPVLKASSFGGFFVLRVCLIENTDYECCILILDKPMFFFMVGGLSSLFHNQI